MNTAKKRRLRQSTPSTRHIEESRDDFEEDCRVDIEVAITSQRQQQQSPKEEWVNIDGNNGILKLRKVLIAILFVSCYIISSSSSSHQNKHTPKSRSIGSKQRKLNHTILEQYGVVEYEVYHNPSYELQLPMAMVVHHREFFAGCHSFERFLSSKWTTIFVLETDIAEEFKLRDLAMAADSPSIHLVLVDPTRTMSGEWLGRKVALEILMMNHGDARPPLLLSTHCDIHPLPEWHLKHRSYEDVVTRMVREFLEEDRMNDNDDTNVNDYRHVYEAAPLDDKCKSIFDNKARPTLVMNTAMLETLPNTDTLEGSLFHSTEAGLSQPWKVQYSKPNHISADKPWLSDISTWVEDHFALYNVTLLERIIDTIAKVHPTISDGDRVIPIELCRRGWKAIRLNDEPVFYDLQKRQFVSNGVRGEFPLYNATNYNGINMDWLLSTSIVNTAKVNSPLATLREYMRLRVANYDVDSWVGVAGIHLQPNHIPNRLWETPIKENLPIVSALMNQLGYVQYLGDDVESREYISFIRVPAFHTTLHMRVLTNFQIGKLEYEDNVTTLLDDRNFGQGEIVRLRTTSTLKKDAYFSGYKFLSCDTCVVYGVKVTKNCWFQGEGHRKDTAEFLCDVIQDKTRQQIVDWIPELESFISLCIPSFPWTTHSWSWGESLQ